MNSVKHPTQGQHQLTLPQLKYSPSKYKNALYKEMAEAYREPSVRKKYKGIHECLKISNTDDKDLPLLVGEIVTPEGLKKLESRLKGGENATQK